MRRAVRGGTIARKPGSAIGSTRGSSLPKLTREHASGWDIADRRKPRRPRSRSDGRTNSCGPLQVSRFAPLPCVRGPPMTPTTTSDAERSTVSLARRHTCGSPSRRVSLGQIDGASLSAAEVEAAMTVFKKYDGDQSGEIDFRELCSMLKDLRIHISDQQLQQYCGVTFADLKRFERFHMGISNKEFCRLYAAILMCQTGPVKDNLARKSLACRLRDMREHEDLLRDAFHLSDVDHSGTITRDEMECLVMELGFEVPKGMTMTQFTDLQFSLADKNSDEHITYAEFADYVNALVDDLTLMREMYVEPFKKFKMSPPVSEKEFPSAPEYYPLLSTEKERELISKRRRSGF